MGHTEEISGYDLTIEETIGEVFAFPASRTQQQLWFIQQTDSESAAYNLPVAFRLKGILDKDVLEQSINEIIKRHETFRTNFEIINGQLNQLVLSELFLPLDTIDIKSHSENEALSLLKELICIPFDLKKGPLLKTALIQISEDDAILLLNFHHIIVDYTSIHAFTKELTSIYKSFVNDENHSLTNPSIQYADLVLWQRKESQVEALTSKLDYWNEQLKGQVQSLDLPTDKKRPARQSFKGDERKIELSKDLTEKLKVFSRKEKKSLFVVLLAAYKILFYRYTNNTDVTVGCPFANRNYPGLEEVMGCCMNTLPLRTVFGESDSFLQVLDKVNQVTLDAHNNQEVSFEQIVENIRPVRDGSINPLFQVSLMYDDSPIQLDLNEIDSTLLEIHNGTSKFDCTLWMWDDINGLTGFFEYNTDLFEPETIDRMINSYTTLLHSIISSPQTIISKLKILSEPEEKSILYDWNATNSEYPKDLCIHNLFEEAVKRFSENTAIDFNNNKITYRELNEKANQLAHYLRGQGVAVDSVVGVYVERTIDMIVGLLGILKAGGAYVPMDPLFPPDRISNMIHDAGIKTLVTQKNLSGTIPSFNGTEICIDTDWSKINQKSKSKPVEISSSKNLAYIIYTSGSTGKPKGVQIEHQSVINFLVSMSKEPGITEKDILLSVTTLSFDVAGLEIFLPLMVGAEIVLASKETTTNGNSLLHLITSKKITVMQATPTTWRMMLAAGWKNRLGIKILCGGEALPQEIANELVKLEGSLWNMYGPTETTIWSAVKKIDSNESKVLIGKPIANTQFYVLDKNKQPVPIGVAGELYIGGDGLAKGYFNRPELTEEKFIANPFVLNESERIYRTGDLIKYLPDGCIEFLGRLDHQVKIRGFRIELEEIESVIAKHPEVNQVVVSTYHQSESDIRIVAYIIPVENKIPSVTNLREHIKKFLPEYMVPSYFEFIQKIPLTPNGKINRTALPEPNTERIAKDSVRVLPSNELELKVSRIWERVLDIKNISVDDNFFELGGHSILAAQMFTELEKETGIKIPLAALFKHQTIRDIARTISSEELKEHWSPLVLIKKGNEDSNLFLVHGAEGNILLYRELAQHIDESLSVYGLQSLGLNGSSYIPASIEEMAKLYIDTIKKVHPTGPYNLGGYCLGGTIALEMAQQLTAAGDKVNVLFLIETYNVCMANYSNSLLSKSKDKIENIKFHFENLMALKGADKTLFLNEKIKVANRRAMVRINSILLRLGIKTSDDPEASAKTITIRGANDKAQGIYKPKCYSGKTVLLKPKVSYSCEPDEQFGWKNLINGEFKVYNLDLAPRGMLMEPYVAETAEIISDEIKS